MPEINPQSQYWWRREPPITPQVVETSDGQFELSQEEKQAWRYTTGNTAPNKLPIMGRKVYRPGFTNPQRNNNKEK